MSVNLPALERNREKNQFYRDMEAEEQKKKDLIKEAKLAEETKMNEEYLTHIHNQRNHENTIKMYNDFIDESRNLLLSEAICQIYGNVVANRHFLKEDSVLFGVSLINAYIKENGAIDILSKMKATNSLLSIQTATAVEEAVEAIIENTDKKNKETFTIPDSIKNNFYNNLDFKSYEDAADMIKCRVSTATEEFVTMNRQDKDNIDELLKNTQEKVNAGVDEATVLFRRKENTIKNRKRNLYEQMVFNLSESVLKESSLLEDYSNEDGRIDIESIMEKAEIQYIVLEMLNTIKLENFTVESITELLENN